MRSRTVVMLSAGLLFSLSCTVSCATAVAQGDGERGGRSGAPTTHFNIPGLVDLTASTGRDLEAYPKPDASAVMSNEHSELVPILDRYNADLGSLRRYFRIDVSPTRRAMMRDFFTSWRNAIESIDFDSLSYTGQIDYILFRNKLDYEIRQAEIDETYAQEIAPLLPFASTIVELEESKTNLNGVDAEEAAKTLDALTTQVNQLKDDVQNAARDNKSGGDDDAAADDSPLKVKPTVANRAAQAVVDCRRALNRWFEFHNSYEAEFTWWCGKPYEAASNALEEYADTIRRELVRADGNDIIGDPIGEQALMNELASEMIPYSPDELIAIANREFEWCENEMLKASRELGYGDDWKAALEYVKTLHVEPGEQAELIRDLAVEAINYVEENDLVTVPELCKKTWRIEMMSPERQRYTPFFTGGEVISVAFPTDSMDQELKMMSLRANNVHFSRATVHHELIPGHHLQGYMNARHKSYRSMFYTPFSVEGWALYWEMMLWDRGFQKSPENRIGMLFWRMHRCARIIFSLSYHLEKMTPGECIDFLVDRVGHERASAEAEVRRSVAGGYGPLYQCAYMLGGLQFRALHHDLVEDGGPMTNRAFHDAILHENAIPVELVRAIMINQPLTRDFKSAWRFYGNPDPTQTH